MREGQTKCVHQRIGGEGVTVNVYVCIYTMPFHAFGSIFVLQCLILFAEI